LTLSTITVSTYPGSATEFPCPIYSDVTTGLGSNGTFTVSTPNSPGANRPGPVTGEIVFVDNETGTVLCSEMVGAGSGTCPLNPDVSPNPVGNSDDYRALFFPTGTEITSPVVGPLLGTYVGGTDLYGNANDNQTYDGTPYTMGYSDPEPLAVLLTPSNVVATDDGVSVDLSWTAPLYDAGSPITGYVVTATDITNSANSFDDACGPASDSSTSTSCVVSDLTVSDDWVFGVAAINGSGDSIATPSNPVLIGTSSAPTLTEINDSSFNEPWVSSSDGTDLWTANFVGNSVSETNIATGITTAITSPFIYDPSAISSDGTDVWVLNGASPSTDNDFSVAEISIATCNVTAVSNSVFDANGPFQTFSQTGAILSDGTDTFVANPFGGPEFTGCIYEIDNATLAVTEIDDPSFNDPGGLAEGNGNLYVSNYAGNSVSVINLSNNSVTVINSSSFNSPIDMSILGTTGYVVNQFGGVSGTGSISEINLTNDAVTEIDSALLNYPASVASTASGVWVVNAGSDDVLELGPSNGDLYQDTDSEFDGIDWITSDSGHAYVDNTSGGAEGSGSIIEITP
jgi:hypothetical protein